MGPGHIRACVSPPAPGKLEDAPVAGGSSVATISIVGARVLGESGFRLRNVTETLCFISQSSLLPSANTGML